MACLLNSEQEEYSRTGEIVDFLNNLGTHNYTCRAYETELLCSLYEVYKIQ